MRSLGVQWGLVREANLHVGHIFGRQYDQQRKLKESFEQRLATWQEGSNLWGIMNAAASRLYEVAAEGKADM